MDSTGALVTEAADSAARGGPARRHDMLVALTDLFLADAPRLGETAVEAFDAVMLPLAREAAEGPRSGLSQRLAPLRNAPRGVVRDLAYDRLPIVATPVLERSSRLALADLAAIAETRPQDHLIAIARRSALPYDLADIVALRGDARAARALARNGGAQLSARARAALAARARLDSDLQDCLRARADLPAQERAGLAALVQDRLGRILERDLGPGAARALAAPSRDTARDLALAEQTVAARTTTGLDERTVLEWLTRRQVLEALTALARRAGVPVATARVAHGAVSYEALLFLVRAAGLSWRTLKLFLTTEPRPRPPDYVLEAAFQTFQSVTVETAARVVRSAIGAGDETRARKAGDTPPQAIRRTA